VTKNSAIAYRIVSTKYEMTRRWRVTGEWQRSGL